MIACFHPRTFREAALILIAAVCLGFAYDAMSPLGVRKPGVNVALPPETGLPVTAAQTPSGTPGSGVQNETITAFIYLTDGEAPAVAVQQPPGTLKWPEVKPMLAKGAITLVDTRDAASYAAGHIPGAVSLPAGTPAEKFAEFMAGYPKTTPFVFYCQSLRCGIAHSVAARFRGEGGYTNVREMPGGYVEWTLAESNGTAATGGGR